MTFFEVMICTALFCIDCFIGASRDNVEYPHAPTPPPSPMLKLELDEIEPAEIDWELVDEG